MENIKVLSHQIIFCHKHHVLFLGESVVSNNAFQFLMFKSLFTEDSSWLSSCVLKT